MAACRSNRPTHTRSAHSTRPCTGHVRAVTESGKPSNMRSRLLPHVVRLLRTTYASALSVVVAQTARVNIRPLDLWVLTRAARRLKDLLLGQGASRRQI